MSLSGADLHAIAHRQLVERYVEVLGRRAIDRHLRSRRDILGGLRYRQHEHERLVVDGDDVARIVVRVARSYGRKGLPLVRCRREACVRQHPHEQGAFGRRVFHARRIEPFRRDHFDGAAAKVRFFGRFQPKRGRQHGRQQRDRAKRGIPRQAIILAGSSQRFRQDERDRDETRDQHASGRDVVNDVAQLQTLSRRLLLANEEECERAHADAHRSDEHRDARRTRVRARHGTPGLGNGRCMSRSR